MENLHLVLSFLNRIKPFVIYHASVPIQKTLYKLAKMFRLIKNTGFYSFTLLSNFPCSGEVACAIFWVSRFSFRRNIIYKTSLYIRTPSQNFIQAVYLQRRPRNQVLGFLFSKLSRFRPREAFWNVNDVTNYFSEKFFWPDFFGARFTIKQLNTAGNTDQGLQLSLPLKNSNGLNNQNIVIINVVFVFSSPEE